MEPPENFSAIRAAVANPPPEALALAKKEEAALEDGAEKVRKEVHSIAVKALRFGAWLLGAVVLVRVWHMAGPSDVWGVTTRWLTDGELQSIDKMLFSSAFGGLVLGYLKEIMRPLGK